MRWSQHDLDRALGQTPCVCGDIDTWHDACYRGKSQAQINREMKQAYQIARRKFEERASTAALSVIRKAAGK